MKGIQMKRVILPLLLLLSCSAGNQYDACVSSCVAQEPGHPAECADACVTHEGDTTVATAEVKEFCELTEDPFPIPAAGEFSCRASCACGGIQGSAARLGDSRNSAINAAKTACIESVHAASPSCSPITVSHVSCSTDPPPTR